MTTKLVNGGAATADRDIIAVRSLMAEDAAQSEKEHAPQVVKPEDLQSPPEKAGASPSVLHQVRPRHLAVASFALFTVAFPWLVLQVVAIMLSPVLAFIIYVSWVGTDEFWRKVRGRYLRLKASNPVMSTRLRSGFFKVAAAWESVLDRLPFQVPDTFYTPDFDAVAEEEAAHQRAVEQRFAKLSEETST